MRSTLTIERFMDGLIRRNPGEVEFHQAVHEVMESIIPFAKENPKYCQESLLERMTEPDRSILFRVVWEDDDGNMRVNKGYRVQFNNSIGPYKGGLRFHPSVNLSILKFLGFEQTFKNSLTGLPMGAGKGGADFNPRGKSDREVMRFCQSYMSELYHHIGPNMDVPAGDIGVGAREISYMFGQYKRLAHEFTGVLTGKSLEFGGSLIRKEATGYGAAFFMEAMLKHFGNDMIGKTCVVSGSGNVATYCVQKILQLGGKVVAMSDSGGYINDPDGITNEKLDYIIDLKTNRRGSLEEYADHYGCDYFEGAKPWDIRCDLAFPCATQNEIGAHEAQQLVGNGCIAVSEGANMPTTREGVQILQEAGVLFAPGKAANAGGVAVSGLEMSQNSLRVSWTAEELEMRLQNIMSGIHSQCVRYGQFDGGVDYVRGANVAGFIKVADAMIAYGVM